MPLVWRIFLGTSLVVALVLGGALAWTGRSAEGAAATSAARGVAALDAEVAAYLDGDARALGDGAAVFAHSSGFRAVVATGAPADALDQSREAAEQLRAAWVQLVDARGVRLAKSDDPGAPAAPMGDSPLVRDALAGHAGSGYGAIGDTALAHVVAVPIEGATRGMIVGALMVARLLDPRAARGAGAAGNEVAFYLLPRGEPVRITAATLPAADALAEAVRALPVLRGAPGGERGAGERAADERATEVDVAGARYVARAHPLRAATGRVLGGYVALRSRAVEYAAFEALRRATLAAGAVGLLAALAVSFAIARQVTRPLAALAGVARRAAGGDYDAQFGATAARRDEVGVLAAAFQTLLDDLHAKQVLVEFARLSRGGRVPSGRARARATPSGGTRAAVATSGAGDASSREATVRFATPAEPAPVVPTPDPTDASADAGYGDAAYVDGDVPAVHAADAAAALRPGQLFADRYLVEAMIGAGATGVVFRAHDPTRSGPVALKVLRPDVAEHDPRALARLRRELATARQLAHPNVVRTYEIGEADGLYFLTMEYVEGRSLRELIDERGPLPVHVAVSAVRQLCRALAHAHASGVLHRDVKPHNAVVTAAGALKVMDFGAALFAGAPRGLTETGTLIGTPAYMAPEVLRGAPADERGDVYAAGVVLYECLTGRSPFESAGASPLTVVSHVLEAAPEDPCALRRDLPRALCDLVLATLAKDPAARPASAEAFERELVAFA